MSRKFNKKKKAKQTKNITNNHTGDNNNEFFISILNKDYKIFMYIPNKNLYNSDHYYTWENSLSKMSHFLFLKMLSRSCRSKHNYKNMFITFSQRMSSLRTFKMPSYFLFRFCWTGTKSHFISFIKIILFLSLPKKKK